MSEQHTKGPWRYQQINQYGDFEVIAPDSNANEGYRVVRRIEGSNAAANAALIASAPEQQARIKELEGELLTLITFSADLQHRLEAEKAELVEACQFFITALDTGLLIRDISKDSQSDWALKMIDFARQLEKAQTAIAKARPDES